jgi:NodT family efflux transporter outer membrane factor (OMF) lipoprotein
MTGAPPRSFRTWLVLAGTTLWLLGCTVGPNYRPPDPPAVPHWKDQAAQGNLADHALADQKSDPDPSWWLSFNDPTLTELIEKGIRNNLDVQQAVLRVLEARQSIATARAAGLPTLSGNASYNREQLGVKGILESKGAYQDLNTLANRLKPLDATVPGLSTDIMNGGTQALNQLAGPTNLFQYGLDASWELDLFGRVRRSVEQARALSQAQSEALNDALIVLESEIVQSYVQLRGAQALKASQEENVKAAEQNLDLTQRRQQNGLTTELDVDQARTQLDDTRRQLPAYDGQVQQAMNALSVLIGDVPGAVDEQLRESKPVPPIPSVVDVGVPSALARRRPDIRQAEANLHAATANVGVAVASFYPDISLTGNIGMRALDASYLTNWASHFYTAGPAVSLPIFSGGRLSAGLTLARAEQKEAALSYRATVLNALREVEDALVAYRVDRASRDLLQDTLDSAQVTWDLARNQYDHGLASFINVLNAESTVLADRQTLVQENVQLVNDIVSLYRALGGGWEKTVHELPSPDVSTSPPPVLGALDRLADPQP